MGGFTIGAAVVVAGASMYASSQANAAADQRAEDANAANSAAANRSRELSAEQNIVRKGELLRRFNIKTSKLQDTNQQINMALSTKLTSHTMSIATTESKTDNVLASKGITGRLAERLRAAQDIQGDMQKGTLISEAEQKHRSIGDNLEMLAMNYESEAMNIDIDTANAINSANNQEVRGWTASTSTGTAGVMASGVSGAATGMSLGMNINKGVYGVNFGKG